MYYYDPMFYIASEKMPFTIRIEVRLKNMQADGDILARAADLAIRRYPYFSVKVEKRDGELIAVPNPEPLPVYPGPQVYPLGGSEVRGHLAAISYEKELICFYMSHVIADGCGLFPFIKTVLYYYLCEALNSELDPKGIRLAGEPLYEDEPGNPFPEEKMASAAPLYECSEADYFRLKDGGLVNDSVPTVYRFSLGEAELMNFSHDHDGSPCALLSSLMVKAIHTLHPEEKKDIVSAVSFNLRPGLGNRHSYRMLCSALKLRYPEKTHGWEIKKLCTCSRGMVTLQSQEENVLYYARNMKERMEKLLMIPDIEEKKRIMGELALKDSVSNTFSISYVGKQDLGCLTPCIESIYNLTDGSTFETLFIEVSAVNGCFYISFLQGFSSDVYYRAFLQELTRAGLHYTEGTASPMNTPKMILP